MRKWVFEIIGWAKQSHTRIPWFFHDSSLIFKFHEFSMHVFFPPAIFYVFQSSLREPCYNTVLYNTVLEKWTPQGYLRLLFLHDLCVLLLITHTVWILIWELVWTLEIVKYRSNFGEVDVAPAKIWKMTKLTKWKSDGWLCWGLTSQSTIFQSCRDGAIASWVINQYFRGVKCLAQGHNTAAVGLEPRTSRSGVRHSTTEPPRSRWKSDKN